MRSRIAAIMTVVALVVAATACGSRENGDDTESTTTTSVDGPAPSGPDGGPDLTDGTFGTIESPCGPGDASGATDIGVTDDAITVYTYDDHESPLQPGLAKGIGESMQAFAKWCNDQGGINGRTLNVEWKSSMVNAYKRTTVVPACESALALVGGMNAFDETGAQDQVNCGLVNVPAAAVSPKQTLADLTYQPLPNPADRFNVGPARWVMEKFPEAAAAAGALALNTNTTEIQIQRQMLAYEQVGFDWIFDKRQNIGEPNVLPTVLEMRDAGVQFLTDSSTYEQVLPTFKAMRDQGVQPTVTQLEANFYNQNFPAAAEGSAEGMYVTLTVWPPEEAAENPAMAEYLAAMEAAVPDPTIELLGVQAWSAGLLFATAAKALGSEVTRAGLAEQLSQITSWTGGGLHGEADPGQNRPSTCFIMMKIEGDGFVRAYPLEDEDAAAFESGGGFACSPDNSASIDLSQINISDPSLLAGATRQ